MEHNKPVFYFCMKTTDENNEYERNWPSGNYCILKHGNCPQGKKCIYMYANNYFRLNLFTMKEPNKPIFMILF